MNVVIVMLFTLDTALPIDMKQKRIWLSKIVNTICVYTVLVVRIVSIQ